jgi:predicted metalloendopeptidase
VQCIIDQYGNYTVDVIGEMLSLNDINGQGENIADYGGVKEAFLAYNSLTQRCGTCGNYNPLCPGKVLSPSSPA